MRSVSLLFAAIAFTFYSFAQAPPINWQVSLGGTEDDQSAAVVETSDNGILVVGNTYSVNGLVSGNNGYRDAWVVKLDQYGNFLWERAYGGSGEEVANDVIALPGGHVVFCGYTNSSDGDVTGFSGMQDAWVVKLDINGNIVWQNCLGESALPDEANAIYQTNDGGFMVTGNSSSFFGELAGPLSGKHLFVAKLHSNGDLDWYKRLGGNEFENGYDVAQTSDGGYVVTGYARSNDGDVQSGVNGYGDIWIVKLDSHGIIEWENTVGGSEWEMGYTVRETPEGNYMVAGYSSSDDGDITENQGMGDLFALQFDSLGNLMWQTTYGGSNNDFAYAIELTGDGGMMMAGNTWSPNDGDVQGNHAHVDAWLVKVDSLGDMEWQGCYGGNSGDFFYDMDSVSDGGYILCGETYSVTDDVTMNYGKKDIWVVKLGGLVGLDDLDEAEINVSPNPFRGSFTVDIGNAEVETIEVRNALGQLVCVSSANSSITTIDLGESATTGVLFVHLLNRNAVVDVVKLIGR